MPTTDLNHFASIAEGVRAACIAAAVEAYEDAGIRGLCDEGRWECAVAAMRRLDLRSLNDVTQTDRAARTGTAPSGEN